MSASAKRRTRGWRTLALLVGFGSAACGPPGDGPPPPAGRFIADYGPSTAEFAAFRDGLRENQFLDSIATRLNGSLRIPHDIILTTALCDEPNASYQPAEDGRGGRVTICYELFRALAEGFAEEPGGEYLVSGTVVFALAHELGHALVDVLNLPVTGREEDAVDQLALMLLLEQGPAGDSLAFGAVGWLAANGAGSPLDSLAFADDHGIGLQRVYNLVCWIYGRDPSRYPQLESDDWLPRHRRARCPQEYRRVAGSWERLLAPHRNEGAVAGRGR